MIIENVFSCGPIPGGLPGAAHHIIVGTFDDGKATNLLTTPGWLGNDRVSSLPDLLDYLRSRLAVIRGAMGPFPFKGTVGPYQIDTSGIPETSRPQLVIGVAETTIRNTYRWIDHHAPELRGRPAEIALQSIDDGERQVSDLLKWVASNIRRNSVSEVVVGNAHGQSPTMAVVLATVDDIGIATTKLAATLKDTENLGFNAPDWRMVVEPAFCILEKLLVVELLASVQDLASRADATAKTDQNVTTPISERDAFERIAFQLETLRGRAVNFRRALDDNSYSIFVVAGMRQDCLMITGQLRDAVDVARQETGISREPVEQPDVSNLTAPQSKTFEATTDADRRFMKMAIEQARKSVGEDGRAHPKVGAVVVKEGSVLATAFRGELGKGEHTEYTALEKKLRDETLTGATVYTTLEPCIRRNHPKTPCAWRLIDRKVKRVVIGMLDPNPRICGKGERLLREHGIEVERFPHLLISELEELNREFVRAHREAEADSAQPQLSSFDAATALHDLHRRVVAAQDRFPREVSFALAMIPHDERQAWDEAIKWFDDMASGPPRKDGWRCLGFAGGGDTSETITIPASENTDEAKGPVIYSLDSWRCWLLRQSTTAPYPDGALNTFRSLAEDACRLLDLRDCGQVLDGQHVGRERGGFQHLLRWCVEQLPPEECEKLTWLDPPNEYVRTTLQAGRTPRRWLVQMPCVFAAVAHALDSHMRGLGKPWPTA